MGLLFLLFGPPVVLLTLAAISHLCSRNSITFRSRYGTRPAFPPVSIVTDFGVHYTPPSLPDDSERGPSRIDRIKATGLGVAGEPIRGLRPRRHLDLPGRLPPSTGRRPSLVETWRESVAGLARLADQNLSLAKDHLSMRNHALALRHAAASLENISRALIHCLGGKPDMEGGQEEALRILSSTLPREEKTALGEAIGSMVTVNRNLRTTQDYLKSDIALSPGQAKIEKIIGSASETVVLLRNILVQRFTSEIPSLRIACPRCQSLYSLLRARDSSYGSVQRECGLCHHKWF